MLDSLSDGQRDMLTVGTIVAPVAGLAYMAAGSDGAFVRAAKRGGILGLFGACGVAILGVVAAKDNDELDNAVEGGAFGAIVGLAAGVVGSFAYDALWAASD